ncbi:MAG: deoxyribose-phosphate aldolase [Bacteroidales bacterium]|nr:deoxyribose-phosphate aldolase [Bacteroidales bacterium]
MIDFDKYKANDFEIEKRISKIKVQGNIDISNTEVFKKILSVIDLTTLEGSDTNDKIINVCKKACTYKNYGTDVPNVAAVCFYPVFIKLAKKVLHNTDVKVASVAGAFPSGQSPLRIKIDEVKFAIDQGADEIDMVINRGKLLEGEYGIVFDEIAVIKEVCKNIHLKVILETGELVTVEKIRKASEIAINAGADFIKTSTGKISPAATEQAFIIMLDTIKEYYQKTNKMIGIKAAGGISEPIQAVNYLTILQNILGSDWMNKNYFRIGASRLADKVLARLIHKLKRQNPELI